MHDKSRCTRAAIHRWWIAAATFAIAVCIATPVWADGPTAEELEAFEGHVERGASLLDEEEYDDAIEELEQAREIIDHPGIALRLAEVYSEWERCSHATEEFESVLAQDDVDERMVQAAEEGLEQLEDCVEMVLLSVECSPDHARLVIRGDEVDEKVDCPFEGEVVAGPLEVRAEADDYEESIEHIELEPGDDPQLTMTLEQVVEEVEPVDDDGDGWVPYASFGAMGAGVLMLAGGGLLDRRAGQRASEMAEARDAGDQQRIDELESDASTARKANIALYAGGLTLLASGVALQFIDFGSTAPEDEPGLSMDFGPGSVSARIQW